MATITTKQIIDDIIAANGKQFDDEPLVIRIVEYTDQSNRRVWGVVWQGDGDPYRYDTPSEFVRDPTVIFHA